MIELFLRWNLIENAQTSEKRVILRNKIIQRNILQLIKNNKEFFQLMQKVHFKNLVQKGIKKLNENTFKEVKNQKISCPG